MNNIEERLFADTVLIAEDIIQCKKEGVRIVVAIAGPPASGKSTLADHVVKYFNALEESRLQAALLPMDGFHLDNRVLSELGLLQKKGAPNTFDVDGFTLMLKRLHEDKDIVHPVFDRSMDIAIAGAGMISRDIPIVIVEGNYLLLNDDKWKNTQQYFDYSVFVQVPIDILQQRLMTRWLEHNFSVEEAKLKAEVNDLPNAELILKNSFSAKRTIVQAE